MAIRSLSPKDGLGEGILTFTDSDGQALPLLFNAVMITQEQVESDDENRSVVYSGSIPLEVSQALEAILVKSDLASSAQQLTSSEMNDGMSSDYGSVTSSSNLDQFTRYSRLQRHLYEAKR